MTIFPLDEGFEESSDNMARARPNDETVASYAERLRAVGIDKAKFDALMSVLTSDKFVRVADVVAIATNYDRGRKPKSKADAFVAIRKRFIELRQIATLTANAEKARHY